MLDLFAVLYMQSLCGLQSSVECVVFDEKEDTIAAGGANGTVKVWDMESGKGECRSISSNSWLHAQ
jgi:WD40 repeat protein